MEHAAVDKTQKASGNGARRSLRSRANAWTIGISVALAAIAAIAGPHIVAQHAAPTREDDCLRNAASDSHLMFEAFFQNPAEQDALGKMARLCRK